MSHPFIRTIVGLTLPLSLVGSIGYATEGYAPAKKFFHEQERGWYYYEPIPEPPPPPEIEKPVPPVPVPPTEKEKDKDPTKPIIVLPPEFEGPEKIKIPAYEATTKAMIEELMEAPSLAKAVAYLRWQQEHMEKAERIGVYFTQATLVNPTLSEAGLKNKPTNADGYARSLIVSREWESEQIKRMEDRIAVIVFYLSDCPYCQEEVHTMKELSAKGIRVHALSLDGLPLPGWTGSWEPDPGIAERLGVEITPTIISFDAVTKEVAILAAGYAAQDEILFRLQHIYDSIHPPTTTAPIPSPGLAPPITTLNFDDAQGYQRGSWDVPGSAKKQWERVIKPGVPSASRQPQK